MIGLLTYPALRIRRLVSRNSIYSALRLRNQSVSSSFLSSSCRSFLTGIPILRSEHQGILRWRSVVVFLNRPHNSETSVDVCSVLDCSVGAQVPYHEGGPRIYICESDAVPKVATFPIVWQQEKGSYKATNKDLWTMVHGFINSLASFILNVLFPDARILRDR